MLERSKPIYAITYCTMDEETGSSMGWHTSIIASFLAPDAKKFEVFYHYGFYGLPPTEDESVLGKVKKGIRLDLDISGNHGMLRPEEMRYLDLGCGLHGVTFEVTEEKFHALQKKCEKMIAEQNEAIDEVVKPLKLTPKPPEKTRIYPYEEYSRAIFVLEKKLAAEQKRPSRLKPFELSLSKNANTCKVQALSLLEGILTPEQITRLTGQHRAVARFSGKTEKMFLHSSGPLSRHVKRSGEVVHYRDGRDKAVKLHWTIPPQEIETLSRETLTLLKIPEEHSDSIKKAVRQLQRLEWFFTNVILDSKHEERRQKLLHLIREQYEAFAVIEPKSARPERHAYMNSLMGFFSYPRDASEARLLTHLTKAKHLLNSIYQAIAEHSFDEKKEETDITLIAYLPLDKKKEICSILDRLYPEPPLSSLPSLGL